MISTSEKVDMEGRSEAHGSQWILCGVGFLLSLCLGSGARLVQQAYTASALPPEPTSLAQFLWVTNGSDSDD